MKQIVALLISAIALVANLCFMFAIMNERDKLEAQLEKDMQFDSMPFEEKYPMYWAMLEGPTDNVTVTEKEGTVY